MSRLGDVVQDVPVLYGVRRWSAKKVSDEISRLRAHLTKIEQHRGSYGDPDGHSQGAPNEGRGQNLGK